MDMAAERSRDGLTGLRDEEKCLGWPAIALTLEKRICESLAAPGRPGVRKIAARFWRQSWDTADHPPFRRAKHRHPLAMAGRSPVSIETVCCFGLCGCAARQPHREPRTFARLARHGHVAAHHARQFAGDGKAEPRPAVAARCE